MGCHHFRRLLLLLFLLLLFLLLFLLLLLLSLRFSSLFLLLPFLISMHANEGREEGRASKAAFFFFHAKEGKRVLASYFFFFLSFSLLLSISYRPSLLAYCALFPPSSPLFPFSFLQGEEGKEMENLERPNLPFLLPPPKANHLEGERGKKKPNQQTISSRSLHSQGLKRKKWQACWASCLVCPRRKRCHVSTLRLWKHELSCREEKKGKKKKRTRAKQSQQRQKSDKKKKNNNVKRKW